MTLYFASQNPHKLEEIQNLFLSQGLKNINLKDLSEFNLEEEIPETGFSLQENAFQKASYVAKKFNVNCFADDTGLEVEALNGEPGVFSARYSTLSIDFLNKHFANSGANSSNLNVDFVGMTEDLHHTTLGFNRNMERLLERLQGYANKKACFRTIICLILNGETYYFEGKVQGEIIAQKAGDKGFGYDPIFQAEGYSQTFAEMPLDLKNTISHRALASQKLIKFLAEYK